MNLAQDNQTLIQGLAHWAENFLSSESAEGDSYVLTKNGNPFFVLQTLSNTAWDFQGNVFTGVRYTRLEAQTVAAIINARQRNEASHARAVVTSLGCIARAYISQQQQAEIEASPALINQVGATRWS